MSTIVDQLAAAHEIAIEQNPRDVLLRRVSKGPDGQGGRGTLEQYVGLVRARLFQGRTLLPREIASEIGLKIEDESWGLLTVRNMQAVDPDTGEGITQMLDGEEAPVMVPTTLAGDTNVYDTFETELGAFKVTDVKPRNLGGEVWGWAAQLDTER